MRLSHVSLLSVSAKGSSPQQREHFHRGLHRLGFPRPGHRVLCQGQSHGQSVCLPAYLLACMIVCLPACLTACVSVCLTACCVSACLSDYSLFACLCVCLSVSRYFFHNSVSRSSHLHLLFSQRTVTQCILIVQCRIRTQKV